MGGARTKYVVSPTDYRTTWLPKKGRANLLSYAMETNLSM
jgi:hypothetical protein